MGHFNDFYESRKANEKLAVLAYMLAAHGIEDAKPVFEWHFQEGQHLTEGEYWNTFKQGFGKLGKGSLAAMAGGTAMANPLITGAGALGAMGAAGRGLYQAGKQWYGNNFGPNAQNQNTQNPQNANAQGQQITPAQMQSANASSGQYQRMPQRGQQQQQNPQFTQAAQGLMQQLQQMKSMNSDPKFMAAVDQFTQVLKGVG